MSTQTEFSTSTDSGGMSIWKIVAVVIAILIVVSMIGPLVKAAFWIGLLALVVVGAYSLLKAGKG
ncbi:hypothetical protein [Gordonia zhaorongruii]|uniref:hypothetical protein n=1 Tax=Gordonia zhaorongruii TaxID=2597659 RepID=UPI001045019F|nr:hypothetical protein [Gordonia zhaorongruii]